MSTPPPPHVCAAFGARGVEPELVDLGPVWRAGDVALRQAVSPAEASWVAQTLGDLTVPDLRVARPVRSSDGRYVVGGWMAHRFLAGRPEPRYDEVISASLRLHKATSHLARPRFLGTRADVFATADRVAWDEERGVRLTPELGGRLFDLFAEYRRDTDLTPQVVHGDLFGNVLFDGDEPPAIMDFTAFHRPPEWAAAVVVVDAMAWGGADDALAKRWAHLQDWSQALLRALLFRLAVHALHPKSTSRSMRGLERAAHRISQFV
ncbi:TIGR02569 family protein [Actinokineospora bangkokensis]|uniref:TIGR02569 family protein n=1 Tax=Actinokineospora bangkokensis TaxID=1193682 RepID=A0A1Q9LDR6_9PSEU|nr:TIGR02569 family protein [Actinokineospora bangkokensis]OLR90156.1 TIGR02569 family protein [Actinokineospora bangkokensis]